MKYELDTGYLFELISGRKRALMNNRESLFTNSLCNHLGKIKLINQILFRNDEVKNLLTI